MLFTPLIAAAILASTSLAAPSQLYGMKSSTTATSTTSTSTTSTSTTSTSTTSTSTTSTSTTSASTTSTSTTSTSTTSTSTTSASTTSTSTTSTSTTSTSTTSTAPASTPAGLSITQQLFLAETAAERFALLPNDNQFVFDFGNPALKGKGGKGGDLVPANRKTFPALVGTGSGMAVGFLGPCGFNTPHVHPRATELQIVVQGRLVTEMLPENGVFNNNNATNGRRVITNTVNTFQMTAFYQGSVQSQFNPDCTNVTFVSALNSEDFGIGQVADELFAMSGDVVSAAFGQAVDGADVEKFKAAIPTNLAKGVEMCLQKCGIAKR